MKKIVLLVVLLCLTCTAHAHPGSTDYKGGHIDRNTGEYHYHHGYSAHQHTDAVCPYDFDDKTDRSYNSSSGLSSSAVRSSQPAKSKSVFDYFMSALYWLSEAFMWILTYGGVLIIPIFLVIICLLTVFFKIKDFFC